MNRVLSAAGLCCCVAALPFTSVLIAPAHADRWEVRQEVREGAWEVAREKREARREIMRCKTRDCARREIREGYREVQREKREARHEIRRELRRYDDDRDDRRDLLTGIAIGAAVIGVAKAISNVDVDEE